MKNVTRREILKGAVTVGALGALGQRAAGFNGPDNTLYRWDIINALGACIAEGGHASSKARDGARITLTGSGTFRDNPGRPQNVTGGGTWAITAGTSTPAGSGFYEVTRFISFDLPPGGPNPNPNNCIGDQADTRPGRLTVAIAFDEGSEGVLEVGCRLPGSPASVIEGITATKGYVTFWNHEEPVPGVEGNRTLFHVLG
jgi:hypothetical protein